jgi:hypothetical protein
VSEPDPQLLSNRVSQSLLGVIDVFSIYLGDRLGFYEALAADGAMTSMALAPGVPEPPRHRVTTPSARNMATASFTACRSR